MAPQLTDEQTKSVYRVAVDANARDEEGPDWWAAVIREMHEVCAAGSLKAATAVIAWWHADWSAVDDTAQAAAKRIRAAAKIIKNA